MTRDRVPMHPGMFARMRTTIGVLAGGLALCAAPAHAAPGWVTPSTLSDAGQHADRPVVAIDEAGTVTAAWRRHDGANWRVQVSSRTPGGAWSTPTTVSAAGADADDPALATGADGHGSSFGGR